MNISSQSILDEAFKDLFHNGTRSDSCSTLTSGIPCSHVIITLDRRKAQDMITLSSPCAPILPSEDSSVVEVVEGDSDSKERLGAVGILASRPE